MCKQSKAVKRAVKTQLLSLETQFPKLCDWRGFQGLHTQGQRCTAPTPDHIGHMSSCRTSTSAGSQSIHVDMPNKVPTLMIFICRCPGSL
jgi:hypothetical protein